MLQKTLKQRAIDRRILCAGVLGLIIGICHKDVFLIALGMGCIIPTVVPAFRQRR